MAENDMYKDVGRDSTNRLAFLDGIGRKCSNNFSFLAFEPNFMVLFKLAIGCDHVG